MECVHLTSDDVTALAGVEPALAGIAEADGDVSVDTDTVALSVNMPKKFDHQAESMSRARTKKMNQVGFSKM
jgi:hypothetical protein